MGADPLQAARNVNEAEKRANDIRVLVARGLIADLVAQLARLMANRQVTGPEEIRLQDQILRETLAYVKGSQTAVLEYLSPNDQARQVSEQSLGLSEMRRLDRERQEALDMIAHEMERDVQQALANGEAHREVVPFGLPKANPTL